MWVVKWQVPSHSNPNRSWTVAVDEQGRWGCNCPQGKFHRDRGPCKHVRFVQEGPAKAARLPSQEPAPAVSMPPPVVVAAPIGGDRLRNVRVVFAELQGKDTSPPESVPEASVARDLLAALEE